jgi:hypothetical protein
MSREAIEEAIEVLEDASAEMLMETGDENYYVEAIAVLRQALVDADDTSQERVDEIVKDEHEPVAFCNGMPAYEGPLSKAQRLTQDLEAPLTINGVPLYPKKAWVGLTDEEVNELVARFKRYAYVLLREVEAKLKEKNT